MPVLFRLIHESDPSPAQRRLQQSLLSASARLVQSCRQLGSVAASSSLTAGQSAATVQLIPGRLDSASTAPRASPLLTALTSYDHSDPSAASLFYTTKDVTSSSPISSSLSVWGSSSHPTTGSQTSPLTLSRAFDAFDALHTRSAVGPPGGYDAVTGIVRLVADRVALPNSLHHVGLLSYLPSAITATYSAPHPLLLPAGQAQQRLSDAHLLSPRVLGDRDQYILLVKRMVELQMLEFTTTPCCVNGLFGVPKGDEEIRLILDARAANCLFVDPPHVHLPTPSHLSQLLVSPGSSFTVAKLDISNFYHQLSLPDWLRSYFALPAISSIELEDLLSLDSLPVASSAALRSGSPVYPCCTTLPMGWAHSVFLAQCIHEHIIYSFSRLSPRDNILNLISPYLDHSVHAI